MIREKIFVGNWKMYKAVREMEEFFSSFIPLTKHLEKSYFAVPFTLLQSAKKAVEKTSIKIGAQNMHDAVEGAFTGEISAKMLKDLSVDFVILGHSERRKIFHETDGFIHKKLLRALQEGILPILCIGETEEERSSGRTQEVLEKQLFDGLEGISVGELGKSIIAYEPVWAIGTGKVATPQIAEEAHAFIRGLIHKKFGAISQKISLLYGGSVKPDNIALLLKEPDIDGVLVGGASLEAKSFAQIVNCNQG